MGGGEKKGIRLLVRQAVTQQGYARFHGVYERCLSVQTTWDAVQAERTGNASYAWTPAQLIDLGLYFDEMRRLWGLVLARVEAVKRLLDVLMHRQTQQRELTSKRATKRKKPDGQGQRLQELLDALRAVIREGCDVCI